MKQQHAGRTRRLAILAVAITTIVSSCDFINRVFSPTSDSTVTSELFKEVTVTITGSVEEAESQNPLGGMTVELVEYDGEAGTTVAQATTDDSGEFEVRAIDDSEEETDATEIPLSIDTMEYRLTVRDLSDDAYFPNEGTFVYAVKDQALEYEIVLVPRNPVSETAVKGLVLDGLTRTTRLPNVKVTLTDSFDSTASYTVTTAEDDPATGGVNEAGTFSVTVPVSSYRVSYDGSALGDQYIVEYEDVVLKNALTNDLGSHYIIPKIPDGEYRVVLQWQNDDENWYELSTYLDVVASDIPMVNTLGPAAGQVEILPRFSLNPGTGFAKDTPYWPTSIVPSGARTFVDADNPLLVIPPGGSSAEAVIDIARDTETGSGRTPIEVVTLRQEWPISAAPENLTYFYRFSGSSSRNYPIGVYNMVVALADWNGPEAELYGIYGSNAEVKLYAGNRFQGAFDIGAFRPEERESNKRTWDVLFIEVGSNASNPTSPADLYLRPVPYFSTWPENEQWGRPPFLTQLRYTKSDNTIDGTDDFGEITSLYYDLDWGLFAGTSSAGDAAVRTLWFNGSSAEIVSHASLDSYTIRGMAKFMGELLVLAESGPTGTVRYVGDGAPLVYDTGTPPSDVNAIYSNPTAEDQRLVAGASDGLYAYYWDSVTGFTWEKLTLPGTTNPSVTDVGAPPRGSRDPVGSVVADGQVFTYNWVNGSFDVHTALSPPPSSGNVITGRFLGYVDALMPARIFWGVTDTGVVYANHLLATENASPPPDLLYTYGTSTAVAVEPAAALSAQTVTAVGTLATEGYSGQPIFGTSAGLFFAEYEEFAVGASEAADYFTLRRYPFAPQDTSSDLTVQAVADTYGTTFLGTAENGIVVTLGGLF